MGKTTCAAALAVAAADTGRRVLIVSTDPAHSLLDVFVNLGGPLRLPPGSHQLGRPVPLPPKPPSSRGARRSAPPPRGSLTRIPTRRGELRAVELDADRALRRWLGPRRRTMATILARGTYLDDDDIDRFLALSLPGVNELIGLVELERLAARGPWDDVIVDTAPTGHTLRLLAMPQTLGRIAGVLDGMLAKHRFLAESLGGRHRPDRADALVAEIERESNELGALLRDPERCAFTWVLLPEVAALEEAQDGVAALEDSGIHVGEIIVNRVTPPRACAFCAARRRSEADVITAARAAFPRRSMVAWPDLEAEPQGVTALRALARASSPVEKLVRSAPLRQRQPRRLSLDPRSPRGERESENGTFASPEGWLPALAPPSLRLLVVAGKGGVGKTSCAAALALALAEREESRRVLLMSVDPAHSLSDVLDVNALDSLPPGPVASAIEPQARSIGEDGRRGRIGTGPPNLTIVELDAQAAFAQRRARYRDAVDELFDRLRGGSRFDATFDRAVVQDLLDLAPSGLDEMFGIVGVIEALFPPSGQGGYDVVVLDTAPTGHALRLLEMPAKALEWVHALLAILLKYRKVIGLGELGADLVASARDLRRLQALLREPRDTRAVLVTRAAEVPRLETVRLRAALRRLGVPVSGIVVNALTPPGCARCRRAAAAETRALDVLRRAERSPRRQRCAIILAPAEVPPPRGVAALARWRDTWTPDSR